MSNMDELKNLVLQTLEAKGVLGPIRAKLRTCVFKVVEQEDANLKGMGNYLENPQAARLAENEDGLICAELIRDFLEFYKMQYTLQIFPPECNLPAKSNVKEKLPQMLGLNKDRTPLLAQLVQMAKSRLKNPEDAKSVPQTSAKPEKAPSDLSKPLIKDPPPGII